MPSRVKCPSCLKFVGALVVDTMRWRGSMPLGSKLFAATCPLCEAVVSASVLLDPHENRSIPSIRPPRARRALNRAYRKPGCARGRAAFGGSGKRDRRLSHRPRRPRRRPGDPAARTNSPFARGPADREGCAERDRARDGWRDANRNPSERVRRRRGPGPGILADGNLTSRTGKRQKVIALLWEERNLSRLRCGQIMNREG